MNEDTWYRKGADDTRRELRRLVAKTQEMSSSGRLAVVLSWLGSDLDEMKKLLRKEEDDEVQRPEEGTS